MNLGPVLLAVVLAVFSAGAALALAATAIAWWHARWWCRPTRSISRRTPATFGLPGERVELLSHGLLLRGWFIPPQRMPAPAVILAHAWSSSAGQLMSLAGPLRRAGFGLLLLDARGHGSSDGGGYVTILTLADDLRTAIDYLESRAEVDLEGVAIVGHSMGGASAIVAGAMDRRARAIVSIAAFADSTELTAKGLSARRLPRRLFLPLVRFFVERQLGRPMRWVSPEARVADVAAPLLLIHGGDDRLAAPIEMDRLWRRSRGQASRLLLADRGHASVLHDDRTVQACVDFLRQAFEGRMATGALGVSGQAADEPPPAREPRLDLPAAGKRSRSLSPSRWLMDVDVSTWAP